jgi:hypothetical protein
LLFLSAPSPLTLSSLVPSVTPTTMLLSLYLITKRER